MVDPISALWILLLYLGIHQIEGHIVVPKLMGSALRLHPLLVIFGLLAGAELYGVPGVFVALPLLAVMRAVWEFFSQRIEFEPWRSEPRSRRGRGRADEAAGACAARRHSGNANIGAVSRFPTPGSGACDAPERCGALVRETRLDLDDFVLPLFVGPATLRNEELLHSVASRSTI